jgi:murein DD-endopeptidase MepM/ murein hydrolase activator NlpD
MSVRRALLFVWVSLGACESPRPLDAIDADLSSPVDSSADTADIGEVEPLYPCPDKVVPEQSSLWRNGTIAPLALRLPIPDGLETLITQGNNTSHTHTKDQRYAWDFGVPIDTPVLSAAGGVVVWVEDGQSGFGPGEEWRDLANFIVLDHGGGLFTSYVHLAAGSAEVAPGDVVEAGTMLGRTGESGQMTGPHLHFQVENVWSESVPARFANEDGCDWLPETGDLVVARPLILDGHDRISMLPADTFAEDGVVDVEGLPARLYDLEMPLQVSGRAPARVSKEVFFLLIPPEGGAAVFAERWQLTGQHRFQGVLDLSGLPPGPYGVALVAGSGGSVRVPRSVLTTFIR